MVTSKALQKRKERELKRAKGYVYHNFWLDKEGNEKLISLKNETGLTISEIINNLIKGGK